MNQIMSRKLKNGKFTLGFKNCQEGYKMIQNGELKDLELYAGDIINLNDDFYLVIPVIQVFENGKRLDYFSLTKIGINFKSSLSVSFTKNRSTLRMLKNSTIYVLGNIFDKVSDLVFSSVLVKHSFKQYKPRIIKNLNSLLEEMQGVPITVPPTIKDNGTYKKSKSSYFNNKNKNNYIKRTDADSKKRKFQNGNVENATSKK